MRELAKIGVEAELLDREGEVVGSFGLGGFLPDATDLDIMVAWAFCENPVGRCLRAQPKIMLSDFSSL